MLFFLVVVMLVSSFGASHDAFGVSVSLRPGNLAIIVSLTLCLVMISVDMHVTFQQQVSISDKSYVFVCMICILLVKCFAVENHLCSQRRRQAKTLMMHSLQI